MKQNLVKDYFSAKKIFVELNKKINKVSKNISKDYVSLVREEILFDFFRNNKIDFNNVEYLNFLYKLKFYQETNLFQTESKPFIDLLFCKDEHKTFNSLNNPFKRIGLLFLIKKKEEINAELTKLFENKQFVECLDRTKKILAKEEVVFDVENYDLSNLHNSILEIKKLNKIKTIVNIGSRLSEKIDKIKGYQKCVIKTESLYADLDNSIIRKRKELAFDALKKIPINEITKGEYRINFLRYEGYKTVADIYNTSYSSLTKCYGIGNKAAEKLKTNAKLFFDKKYEKSVVKLNEDKKHLASRRILLLINKIIESEKIARDYQEDFLTLNLAKHKASQLAFYEDLSLWSFLKEEERKQSVDLYREIKDVIKELGDKIVEVFNNLTKYSVSEADLWLDFCKRPIEYIKILEGRSVNDGVEPLVPSIEKKTVSISNDFNVGYNQYLFESVSKQTFNLTGMKTSLRKYQEDGVRYILHQKCVILGDEMGLGKTIEAIASMVSLRNEGHNHFVVVCPAGIIVNWCREISRHSDLQVFSTHQKYTYQEAVGLWKRQGGVMVTTYGILKHVNEYLKGAMVSMLVVDEAHYVKNKDTIRHSEVQKLVNQSNYVLFMTGTVLENRVNEMISLISMLTRSLSRELKMVLEANGSISVFYQKLASVYIRRKREQVANELPELIESEEWCQLTDKEKQLYYQAILDKDYHLSRRVSWQMDILNESSKAKRLLELVESAEGEGRKVLVFSFFLDTINFVKTLLGDRCLQPITGSVTSSERQAIIDKLDQAKPGTVLCCQIMAGGIGLNIQSASVVVICEPQFKPSTENQAISRAYRMGQTRNVLVYRLLAEDTIDERINETLKIKQKEFNVYADKSKYADDIEINSGLADSLFNKEYEKVKELALTLPETPKEKVDYDSLLNLSYEELVDKLKEKYGTPQGDYFLNETCNSVNNKIKRSNEGLYIHHIDEDKKINLSKPELASNAPFNYQKADRLVYCNILEHLILHIKIVEKDLGAINNELVGAGGIVLITPVINDCYIGKYFKYQYLNQVRKSIVDSYDDYVKILKYLISLPNYYKYKECINIKSLCLDSERKTYEKLYNSLRSLI